MSDRFEQHIAHKFNSFEPRVNPEMWHSLTKRLDGDAFESQLHQKLSGVSIAPSQDLWASIESRVPNSFENKLSKKLDSQSGASIPAWDSISSRLDSLESANFEQHLQSKFSSFEMVPSSSFAGVEQKLRPAQNTRRYWMAAAMVLFALLTSLLVPKYTKDSRNLQAFLAEPSQNSSSKGPLEKTLKSSGLSLAKEDDTDYTTSDKQAKRNSNEGSSNIPFKKGKQQKVAPSKTSKRNDRFALKGTDKKSDVSKNSGNLLTANANELEEIIAMDAMNVAKLSNEKVLDYLPQYSIVLEKTTQADAAPESEIALSVQNGLFAVRLSESSLSNFDDKEYRNYQNQLHGFGTIHEIGTRVAFKLKNKHQIVTGISLAHARQQLSMSTVDKPDAVYNNLSVPGEDISTTNYVPTKTELNKRSDQPESQFDMIASHQIQKDSIVAGDDIQLHNRFTLIELPIGLRLALGDSKCGSFHLNTGLKGRLIASAHTYHVTHERDAVVEVQPAMSQTFYKPSAAVYAGLDIDTKIGKNISMTIGPEVTVNASTINRNNTWLDMRPWQIGLRLSVRQVI